MAFLLRQAVAAGPTAFHSMLARMDLFELVALLQLPRLDPEKKGAVERAIVKLIPATSLGSKITLARRASARILQALLQEREPRLIEAVLGNPALQERGISSFLATEAATAEVISAIARHPRWGTHPALRQAILHNRKTPAVWFTLFLPSLPEAELSKLLAQRDLDDRQRGELLLEVRKRRGETTS